MAIAPGSPAVRTERTSRWLAVAACFAVVIAGGLWVWSRASARQAQEHPLEQPPPPAPPTPEEQAVQRIREGLDALAVQVSKGQSPEAQKSLDATRELVRAFEASSHADDPLRKTVADLKRELEDWGERAIDLAGPAETVDAAQEAYTRARDAMLAFAPRMEAPPRERTAETEKEAAQVRKLLQEALARTEAEDSRHVEAEYWLSNLEAWERGTASAGSAAKADPARDALFAEAMKAAEAALAVSTADHPAEALKAIDAALDRLQYYESTAQVDDPHLAKALATAEDLLTRRKAAEQPAPVVESPAPKAIDPLTRKLLPSVVYVKVARRGAAAPAIVGSGFVTQRSGYVITSRHLLDGATSISVGWDARSGLPEVAAKLVRWTTRADLAVLKLPAGDYTALRLSSNDPPAGRKGVAFGFRVEADGATLSSQVETVAGIGVVIGSERRLVQLSQELDPSESGGVLMDETAGQVLAIATVSASGPLSGHSYALPASVARTQFLPLWSETGYSTVIDPPAPGTGVGNPCKNCHGKGVPCNTCKGRGKVTSACPACDGRGFREVIQGIGGPKRVPCRRCQGSGKIEVACPTCSGKGVLPCPLCGAGGN